MIVASWNVRGFSLPFKHNGVKNLIMQHSIDVIGLLETKINDSKLQKIMHLKFQGWSQINNFHTHGANRILVLWNPSKVSIELEEMSSQSIHYKAQCKVTSIHFLVSFIYGFNSIMGRRPLWANLCDYNRMHHEPWIVLRDFNNVINDGERINR